MGLALTSPGGRCIRLALFIGLAFKPFLVSAQVVELVDALASGASDRKVVKVRVLSWAPRLVFVSEWNELTKTSARSSPAKQGGGGSEQ